MKGKRKKNTKKKEKVRGCCRDGTIQTKREEKKKKNQK